ncbi:uncharacterized protein LOC110700498 [Chenopodium quinoa]|uniref:uncharacterized protein LOC110700498 n=1 Tax=Chenopodium quinoa TaxID=63459 RepID=UPI000B79A5F9|nr:uncharacterized protein LOC110700498 [Chenopodium quinoa]
MCLDLINPLSAAAGFTTPASGSRLAGSEDQSPRWPDVQKHAKAMLEAVRMRDKDNTPRIETFNLERVLSLLAEAMLRVDGLKRPYSRKREEAFKIQQLELDLKAADQRATNAETAKKGAEEAQKKADESAKKADEALKKAQADLGKLKTKVERLEKDAAQAQKNFAATLEVKQNRLVAESDADNDARMKIAWAALYPDADYSIWAMAHSYAEYVVYLREQGEPDPASFEAWINSNEPAAPELPCPGEAH